MSKQRNNERVVREFLQFAHRGHAPNLHDYVADSVKCWGFPEFNPANRDEYQGFFNYLADVFSPLDFNIEQLLADDSQVLVRFRVSGKHHEEFMGLPASGGKLELHATALFRLHRQLISEVWMYNKRVTLVTPKGFRYSSKLNTAVHCLQQRRALAS